MSFDVPISKPEDPGDQSARARSTSTLFEKRENCHFPCVSVLLPMAADSVNHPS